MDWNCAPTCIGSLPHDDPRDAVNLIMEQLQEIPFWPQLPTLGFGENMYAQYSTWLPGIKLDEEQKRVSVDLENYDPEKFYTAVVEEDIDRFSYPRVNFHGFYEFLRRHLGDNVRAVKGQITGPISVGLQIIDQNGKSAIYDDAYGEIIRKNLNLSAKWQERKLRQRHDNVIMFLDEPSLSLVGTPFAPISQENVVSWINEVLEGLRCIKGLHCCGNTDWPMVLSTNIDLLSFDAYSYAFSISLFPKEVEAFLERGGTLSWGIVPNMDSRLEKEDGSTLLALFDKAIEDLAVKGVSKERLLRQSIITPQCGLGGLDGSQARQVMLLLNQLSIGIRQKYSLG
jgi:methionine synthase II (cobalamin-independent)